MVSSIKFLMVSFLITTRGCTSYIKNNGQIYTCKLNYKERIKTNLSKKLYSIVAILVLVSASLLAAGIQLAGAHTPAWEIPTYPYLAVSPNPVGVGQSVFLVFWLHGAPPSAEGVGGDRYRGMTIEIATPDGHTQNLGPFISDPTGAAWTIFTPDQVGSYTITFKYPGQTLSRNHPETGIPGSNSAFIGDKFLASSVTEHLTVQQAPIEKIPDSPLPTTFWTRPIYGENTAWASITSQWLGGAHIGFVYGGSINLFQSSGIAPDTPHIMWTMPIEFGGVVGGTTAIPGVTYYSGGSYEGRFTYSIIMNGRLYFMMPLGHAAGARNDASGYACVDLRTGEIQWISEEISFASSRPIIKGQLFDYESMNQHGVVGGIIWEEAGSTWIAYDGFSGNWLYNLTNVPSGTEVYTAKGEIVRYVLDYENRRLALWNNTQDNVGLHGAIGTGSSAYQWRPNGKEVNMSTAYSWNVSIPALPGVDNPAIVSVLPGDLILGRSTSFPSLGGRVEEPKEYYTMWAISDRPATRGQLLWIKNYDPLPGMQTRTLGPVDPDNRVFTMSAIETFEWYGFDLDTGEQIWGPAGDDDFRAFQYYGSGEGGGQKGFAAYGNIYVQGFGGEIHCYNAANGNLLWKYSNTNSGEETPWGYYPLFVAAIADGKVYAFNNEHSPNAPYYKGEKVRCINAFTGEEVWAMSGWSGQTGGRGTSTAVLADGFLNYYNYYDNQVYCIGKGPSQTTVAASPKVANKGATVLIEGTVQDISAGAKQKTETGEFNTVPLISDADMSTWMEYIYMQKPMPTDATGVAVKLTAMDSNGNSIPIGTVTSDLTGNFAAMWTPPAEGIYKITACFEGSGSYWPSTAETNIGVSSAPAASPTTSPSVAPGPEAAPGTDIYIIAAAAVIIVVVAAAAIILRRRK